MNQVFRAYLEAALWSSLDDDGIPLDYHYSISDISDDSYIEMNKICTDFVESIGDLYEEVLALYLYSEEYTPEDLFGHDLWMTQNHHGVGFWSRGFGEIGVKVTEEVSSLLLEKNLVIGDDGKLYLE